MCGGSGPQSVSSWSCSLSGGWNIASQGSESPMVITSLLQLLLSARELPSLQAISLLSLLSSFPLSSSFSSRYHSDWRSGLWADVQMCWFCWCSSSLQHPPPCSRTDRSKSFLCFYLDTTFHCPSLLHNFFLPQSSHQYHSVNSQMYQELAR